MKLSATHRVHAGTFSALVLVPILVGSLIYVLWRSPTLLMFQWFDAIGMSRPINACRSIAAPAASYLPRFVLYSLPSALWVFSFASYLGLIWMHRSRQVAFLLMIVPPAFAIVGEIGQAVHLVPGAFDVIDVVLCVTAAFAAHLVSMVNYQKGSTL